MHYIQYDDYVFRLSTQYKHQLKTNGTSEHINKIVYSAQYAKEHIVEIIEEQTKRIKDWKNNIDIMPCEIPNYNEENLILPRKRQNIRKNLINKIKKFFFK